MDGPKPATKEYHEGAEAARRFEGLVTRPISVLGQSSILLPFCFYQHPHVGLRAPSQQRALLPEQPQTPPCQEQHPALASRLSAGAASSHSCEGEMSVCAAGSSTATCSPQTSSALARLMERHVTPNTKVTNTVSFFMVRLLCRIRVVNCSRLSHPYRTNQSHQKVQTRDFRPGNGQAYPIDIEMDRPERSSQCRD